MHQDGLGSSGHGRSPSVGTLAPRSSLAAPGWHQEVLVPRFTPISKYWVEGEPGISDGIYHAGCLRCPLQGPFRHHGDARTQKMDGVCSSWIMRQVLGGRSKHVFGIADLLLSMALMKPFPPPRSVPVRGRMAKVD